MTLTLEILIRNLLSNPHNNNNQVKMTLLVWISLRLHNPLNLSNNQTSLEITMFQLAKAMICLEEATQLKVMICLEEVKLPCSLIINNKLIPKLIHSSRTLEIHLEAVANSKLQLLDNLEWVEEVWVEWEDKDILNKIHFKLVLGVDRCREEE